MTGTPQAIASSAARPKLSVSLGEQEEIGVAQDGGQIDALAEKLDVGAEAERGDLGGDARPLGAVADQPQAGRAARRAGGRRPRRRRRPA